jgi:hypothetical protein
LPGGSWPQADRSPWHAHEVGGLPDTRKLLIGEFDVIGEIEADHYSTSGYGRNRHRCWKFSDFERVVT